MRRTRATAIALPRLNLTQTPSDARPMDIASFLQQNWVAITVVAFILLGMRGKGNRSEVRLSFGVDPKALASNLPTQQTFGGTVSTRVVEVTSSDPIFPQVMEALQRGDKIQAIKILREAKQIDLTMAKQLVDVLDRHRDPMRVNP